MAIPDAPRDVLQARPVRGSPLTRGIERRDLALAGAIVLALLALYNANGREIGSVDSQPAKFAAREFLLRGSLRLNHVVGTTPLLLERAAFVRTRDGHYRSGYSPVPSLLAAGVAWPFWKTGVIDVRAVLAPNLIAVMTASLLTALAVALAFLAARQRVARREALLLAVGLGLGTGYWTTVSQTLWQHETAAFGLGLAVLRFAHPDRRLTLRDGVLIGLGLALAGASRPQLAPAIALLLAGTLVRGTLQASVASFVITASAAGAIVALNVHWFGSPMGGLALLVAQQGGTHLVSRTFEPGLDGLLGLLISPSRGLLVFSPIVGVVLFAARDLRHERWTGALRWLAVAAFAQYLFYASYAVWWAGHTFGPRYLLDVLPLLVPLAAAGIRNLPRRWWSAALVGIAMTWSIACAATGAFCYPHERWNTDPLDVDRRHDRLWEWSDPQVVRCWRAGFSPQNFRLLDWHSVRVMPR